MAPAPNAGKVPSVRKLLKGTEMNDSFLLFSLVIFLYIRGYLVTPRQSRDWSGLPRSSTSSPSSIFEALFPAPNVVTDVLVLIHGRRGWWAEIWDTMDESQGRNKDFENPGWRGRRRPAEAWHIGQAIGSPRRQKPPYKILDFCWELWKHLW